MTKVLTDFIESIDNTPQSEAIPGSTQVPNSAGGFAWEIDDWAKLHRFLVIGTDGGTYYIDEKKLTAQNAGAVARCLKADPVKTINIIVDISTAGRAPNNDYALFALAMASSERYNSDSVARGVALAALPKVARTGTHLFHFAEYVQGFRGWGRGLRAAVANWYESKEPDKLAYQAIKYRQRDGWTHHDMLRLGHPEGRTESHKSIYDFASGRESEWRGPEIIDGFKAAQAAKTEKELVAILTEYPSLPHEALPTELKNKPAVVSQLLENGVPMGALVRNLATYTRAGVLDPGSEGEKIVLAQLANQEQITKSRIHPINVLSALMVYSNGTRFPGERAYAWDYQGKGVENPNPRIIDALDEVFYLAFDNVEPTGKTFFLGLDISGSMSGAACGIPGLTCALGAAAMAMVTARSGDPYVVKGFSTQLKDLGISAKMRLDDVLARTARQNFGGTDCALPMSWAESKGQKFDVFNVYTDNETWAGTPHPSQALKSYRKAVNPQAKLAVIGMASNGFSIADPNDAGMMDFVGFDSATPSIIADFARGTI